MAYKQRWSDLFAILDISNTPAIDKKDADTLSQNIASHFGQLLQGNATMQAFDSFFVDLIQNFGKDGKMTKEQLIQGVEKNLVGKSSSLPAWWTASVGALFTAYNINKEIGILSVADVADVVHRFQPGATQAAIQNAYNWALHLNDLPKTPFQGGPGPVETFNSITFSEVVFQWGTSAQPTPEAQLLLPFFQQFGGIVPLSTPTKSSG